MVIAYGRLLGGGHFFVWEGEIRKDFMD